MSESLQNNVDSLWNVVENTKGQLERLGVSIWLQYKWTFLWPFYFSWILGMYLNRKNKNTQKEPFVIDTAKLNSCIFSKTIISQKCPLL